MASWSSVTLKFDIFEPLRPPIQSALQFLETVEAILEALLDLIRPFFLDLLNPLRALIALLLAALRAIINQIRSTGFSILLVHPDFSQPDFAGVLYSVSGAYPGFESKVVGKFFDTSDIFRPQYTPGMSVAMLVLYVGADSPGDLLGLLFALLALIRHPVVLTGLPAPVDVKALPVTQGTSSISQFRRLFDPDLNQAVQLEWRMPQSPAGMGAAGFVGQVVSFYNQFRFPNFIIERTGPFPRDEGDEELSPQGDPVFIDTSTQTIGKGVVDGIIEKYSFPIVNSRSIVREDDGSVYRNFPKKIAIQFGSDGEAQADVPQGSAASALASATSLVTGIATGTYKYLDEDPSLVPGRTYYYRIRAFFGDATDYLQLTSSDPGLVSQMTVTSGSFRVLRTAPKLTLGRPSRVVKGFVPRKLTDPSGASLAFNAYENVFSAVMAGLLLNFELPPAFPPESGIPNTVFRNEQRTGWGTLGLLGGQIGPLKAGFDKSDELIDNVVFRATARRLANSVATQLFSTPELVDLLTDLWTTRGVSDVVERLIPTADVDEEPWSFVGIVGGITPQVAQKINEYLSREETYVGGAPLTGPVPIIPVDGMTHVTVEERVELANFLRTALSVVSHQTSYLAWYSVTVGDLFPALIPFLFDFEQFLKALLKALNDAIKEIEDIIETLLQKIRALIQILRTLDEILSLLEINVTVSVLGFSSTNGSAETLVQELIQSEDKPGDSPFGLHSGMVMTFGGPGEGFIAAFEALKFILTLPL